MVHPRHSSHPHGHRLLRLRFGRRLRSSTTGSTTGRKTLSHYCPVCISDPNHYWSVFVDVCLPVLPKLRQFLLRFQAGATRIPKPARPWSLLLSTRWLAFPCFFRWWPTVAASFPKCTPSTGCFCRPSYVAKLAWFFFQVKGFCAATTATRSGAELFEDTTL